MSLNEEQKNKLRELYNDMVNEYNQSNDITDARAYQLYLTGMKDTLQVFGLTIDDFIKY